jgi:hypothetical protein
MFKGAEFHLQVYGKRKDRLGGRGLLLEGTALIGINVESFLLIEGYFYRFRHLAYQLRAFSIK